MCGCFDADHRFCLKGRLVRSWISGASLRGEPPRCRGCGAVRGPPLTHPEHLPPPTSGSQETDPHGRHPGPVAPGCARGRRRAEGMGSLHSPPNCRAASACSPPSFKTPPITKRPSIWGERASDVLPRALRWCPKPRPCHLRVPSRGLGNVPPRSRLSSPPKKADILTLGVQNLDAQLTCKQSRGGVRSCPVPDFPPLIM